MKQAHFGTTGERGDPNATNLLKAKRLVFRYGLFVHRRADAFNSNTRTCDDSLSSGVAELPGNDFIVALGPFTFIGGHGQGNVDEQAGTFTHEFGHTLNLHHGGADDFNCKPNYLSVMSYSRQFDNSPVPGRVLDYSRIVLPPTRALDEAELDEAVGIGGPPGERTVYGPWSAFPPPVVPPAQPVNIGTVLDPRWVVVTPADQPIDWNQDGDSVDLVGGLLPSTDINNFGLFSGCNGEGALLMGHDDWTNLQYNFRTSFDFADGVHATSLQVEELTHEQAMALSPDTDGDGFKNLVDNCPLRANADQADRDQDGVGDTCDNCATIFNPGQEDVDQDGRGDACPVIDRDSDGVADDEDPCPDSDLTANVVIDGCDSGVANARFTDGCTISDQTAACAASARNHGQFVSCIADLTNDLKRDGVITGQEKGAIQGCAAGANIP